MQNALSQDEKIIWTAPRLGLLRSYRIVSGKHASAYSICPDDDIIIATMGSLVVNNPAFRARSDEKNISLEILSQPIFVRVNTNVIMRNWIIAGNLSAKCRQVRQNSGIRAQSGDGRLA